MSQYWTLSQPATRCLYSWTQLETQKLKYSKIQMTSLQKSSQSVVYILKILRYNRLTSALFGCLVQLKTVWNNSLEWLMCEQWEEPYSLQSILMWSDRYEDKKRSHTVTDIGNQQQHDQPDHQQLKPSTMLCVLISQWWSSIYIVYNFYCNQAIWQNFPESKYVFIRIVLSLYWMQYYLDVIKGLR